MSGERQLQSAVALWSVDAAPASGARSSSRGGDLRRRSPSLTPDPGGKLVQATRGIAAAVIDQRFAVDLAHLRSVFAFIGIRPHGALPSRLGQGSDESQSGNVGDQYSAPQAAVASLDPRRATSVIPLAIRKQPLSVVNRNLTRAHRSPTFQTTQIINHADAQSAHGRPQPASPNTCFRGAP